MTTKRSLCLLLATGAIGLVAAAPAAADSVVYLKNGDVFLTPGDASREFQVTSGGGFTSVSQADDGTIAAVDAARNIVRMDRLGNRLSSITTVVSSSSGTALTFQGPFDIDVSPDGQTIAYGYQSSGIRRDPVTGELYASDENGTGFTRATELTGFTDEGYENSRGYWAPEFVTNEDVIVSFGPSGFSDPVATLKRGSGDTKSWFNDAGLPQPTDAAASRDGRYVAAIRGDDRKALRLYENPSRQLGADPSGMRFCVEASETGDYRFSSATLNANGTRVYWSNGRELELMDIPADCTTISATRKTIPGATSPDWGPADVPTGRPAPPRDGGPPPGSGGGQTQPGRDVTKPGAQPGDTRLKASARKAKLATLLRKGLKVRVAAPAAGKVTGVAKLGRRTVARGTARARTAGAISLTLKPTKAGKRTLRKARKGTLKLTISQGATRSALSVPFTR